MLYKKLISIMTASVITLSAFPGIIAQADDEYEPIKCTQSVSIINNGANFTLNTADKDVHDNISWNNTSGEWKGIGVLEFELPAVDPALLKSAELTYAVHNGSSRSGGRTYTIYESDIVIDENTTAEKIKAIQPSVILYNGAAVAQGQTRVDTVPSDSIKDYVKSRISDEEISKVQFAFSNSNQVLDIDPSTAYLKITVYGGGIALDKHELTLLTSSAPVDLSVNIFEDGVDREQLIWESSDNEVASVENGTVIPKKTGSAVITVKTADGIYSDECAVYIEQAAESIYLDNSELNLMAGGENGELVVKFEPDNAVNRSIEWISSDTSVTSVSSNGIITPVSEGTATITATVKGTDISAKCEVNVSSMVYPESIDIIEDSISMPKLGSTVSINANILPDNADKRLTWTSSDEKVAKVYNGVVVSGEPGTAVIKAASANGKTAECTVTVTDDKQLITNDRFYTDTDGNTIFSQGGGIFKFPGDDKYYWYGVRYAESVTYAAEPNGANRNVEHPVMEAYTCYSSTDLVNWKYEGDVANQQTLGQSWCGWAGRCGVVYNEKTGRYVLVSQFNGTIIASADNPFGPFGTEKGYFWGGESLPVIANGDTGDLTMFYGEDGSAYMICSSASGRNHLYVVPMRASDYCDFDFANIREIPGSTSKYFDEDGTIKSKDKGGIEGDCMFKYKDHYYFTGSDLYGWHGSRCYVFESEEILGDYNIKPDYVPEESRNQQLPYIMPGVKNSYAHNSQTGFYYTLHGSEQDLVIYCGDRWSSFCSNGLGFNQWVPLTMEGYTPQFNDLSQWRLDAEKGTWEIGNGNNYVSNSYFDADRVDLNNLVGWECSDNIGGTANGNVKDKLYSGKYSASQSAQKDYIATMRQKISDLPDGIYTLRAIAKSSGGQNECKLYLKTDKKEYSSSLKASMNNWTDVVIQNIEIKNGECEIGLFSDACAGNWVRLDDVFLTRNYDGTIIEGEMNTDVPGASEVYAEDGVAVIAEYEDSGVLKSVRSIEKVSAGDEIIKSDDAGVRVFAWNSLDEMIPLKTKTEISVQERQ